MLYIYMLYIYICFIYIYMLYIYTYIYIQNGSDKQLLLNVIFPLKISKAINPNLGGLFRAICFEVGRHKITPCLKPIRIMLET